jgi:Icc-related predicted phosphoesterase
MTVRNLVIGDVHGRLDKLKLLLSKIDSEGFEYDRIIQVGDFGWFRDERTEDLMEFCSSLEVPFYWIDGNHEDHQGLETHKKHLVKRGYCRRGTIKENILLVGGASSTPYDKYVRATKLAKIVGVHLKHNDEYGTKDYILHEEGYKTFSQHFDNYCGTLKDKPNYHPWYCLRDARPTMHDLIQSWSKIAEAASNDDRIEEERWTSVFLAHAKKIEEDMVKVGDELYPNVRSEVPNVFWKCLTRACESMIGCVFPEPIDNKDSLSYSGMRDAIYYLVDASEQLTIKEAQKIIDRVGDQKIDIMISHTCPSSFYMGDVGKSGGVAGGENKGEMSRQALEMLLQHFKPKHCIFGHWHNSKVWYEGDVKATLLDRIDALEEDDDLSVHSRMWTIIESE